MVKERGNSLVFVQRLPVNTKFVRLVLVTAALWLLYGLDSQPRPVVAQEGSLGALCVLAFADANSNGVREAGESALAGASFNLSTGGVIIATHIATGDETPYCFENLPLGTYTVALTDSLTYRVTTPTQSTYTLQSGQRLSVVSFGAVPVPFESLRAEIDARIAVSGNPVGKICVATYADTNASGQRDGGETLLPGINVDLSTGGVIVATHIIAEGEASYCFMDQSPGIYTVAFADSPIYRATTASTITFRLEGGQTLFIDPSFGAVPVPLADLRAEVEARYASKSDDEPLDTSTRLLLATIGSLVVMIFMIGIGAVVLGLGSWRRKRPRSPHELIGRGGRR
jgi:hypothetical protein